MKETEELYFVFLGDKLPKYVIPSLTLAVRHSGLSINLIGYEIHKSIFVDTEIKFISTKEFYDRAEFIRISQNLISNHSDRDGFWLKTLERFFVLEQFMKFRSIHALLHAELDQLIFGLDELYAKLNSLTNDGLYIPLHNEEEAIASVIYIRNPEVLTSMIDYAQSVTFQNEMRLISSWGNNNPHLIYGLPTIASELNYFKELKNIKILDSKFFNGIFDAAQLGQWVAGIDPRNVPIRQRPANKFIDTTHASNLREEQINNLSFIMKEASSELFVKYNNEAPIRLYNLHIHSKIHSSLLHSKPSLQSLIDAVNKPGRTSFWRTQVSQIANFFVSRFLTLVKNPKRVTTRLSRLTKSTFRVRSSSKPFISGDSFRKNADLVWEKSKGKFTVSDVQPHYVIFCESDCLLELNEKILSKLNVPINLILGNSDQNHDFSHVFLTKNPFVKMVYAQNLMVAIDRFYPLPIGLENRWRSNHGKISAYKKSRKVLLNRKPRIMWTFSIETNPEIRGRAAIELSKIRTADRFGFVSSSDHRKLLLSYSFIASPPGNGLDTHRTWEAMYLGCVPIVLRSYMTESFQNLGLPVWVVDSYEEIASLNENELGNKYKEFRQLLESKALWFDFWEKQIIA